MKLQISFDLTDLGKALKIASEVEQFATSLEIGSLLLYKYGVTAIEEFRKTFPNKTLFVDAKIIDQAKESMNLFCKAGADWVTVMAGTSKNIIRSAGTSAHALNAKIMLDLLDSSSLGQSALEAKGLEVDALLLHRPYDEENSLIFLDQWDMVRGNSQLPIYISGRITREILDRVLSLKPDGIAVGKTIVEAENPAQEAQYFFERIREPQK